MNQKRGDLRVALVGYGAMGREIERRAQDHGVEIVARFDAEHPFERGGDEPPYDLAIEFTLPAAAPGNLRLLLESGVPVVCGTTGWHEREEEIRGVVEQTGGRLLVGTNFSIGVQLFLRVVRRAAELIDRFESYDVALHEVHHTRKADAPSGTARTLAGVLLDEIARKQHVVTVPGEGAISPDALLVSSSRVGSVPGTHEVLIDSIDDTIELTHRARGRGGFADGALRGARWLHDAPPGFYRFDDIFDLL